MIMLLLNPIWPNGLIAQYDDILIYDNSEGFMAMCCPYKVTERQYLLFEKEVGEFQLIETLDPKKAIVKNLAKIMDSEGGWRKSNTCKARKRANPGQ